MYSPRSLACIQYTMNKTKKIVRVKRKTQSKKKDERSLLQKVGAMTLRGGGAAIGYGLGNPTAGYNAGASFSKFLGFGDYTVKTNSIVNKAAQGIPVMHSTNMSTIVRHREYIGDVYSSPSPGQFVAQQYVLNPGMQPTFPWLSSLARQYQEYSFKGVVFEYISTSANALNSVNTALGTVMMGTQYRSTAPPFTNKIELLNEYYSTDAKPSENFVHAIECDPKENPFQVQYVRMGDIPLNNGEDPKMYDLGTFTIASVGCQGVAVNLGELWVSYEVELKKPQLGANLSIGASHYITNGTLNSTNPIGTTNPTKVYDNIGVKIEGGTTKTITFPLGFIGNVSITIVWGSTVTAFNIGGSPTFTAGVIPWTIYRSTAAFQANYTAGAGQASVTYFFQMPNSPLPSAITLPTLGALTGTIQGDIYINTFPTGFT